MAKKRKLEEMFGFESDIASIDELRQHAFLQAGGNMQEQCTWQPDTENRKSIEKALKVLDSQLRHNACYGGLRHFQYRETDTGI